jgi:hypothetical protein
MTQRKNSNLVKMLASDMLGGSETDKTYNSFPKDLESA